MIGWLVCRLIGHCSACRARDAKRRDHQRRIDSAMANGTADVTPAVRSLVDQLQSGVVADLSASDVDLADPDQAVAALATVHVVNAGLSYTGGAEAVMLAVCEAIRVRHDDGGLTLAESEGA